ncbi:ubiquitin carboxyl-terminal hydrolase 36-like isoform X2 [Belonocnema kinseyi]|uniref:ubiquitin carboxyl-terminal hydrolase 36-like isoform X2 n=1 Tax=Belonocnema kinseyi TaxID=2817044 RepID=UPI00143D2269|nr:ubiquitin carboxyl-terminal hydrolase 36-like isoform X2 [Belonocnema kinseyi]
MPAVSICDSVAVALRNSLESSQSKSDDLSITIADSYSRIAEGAVEYEKEAQTCKPREGLDPLKLKIATFYTRNSDNSDSGNMNEDASSSKRPEGRKTEHTLPAPKHVLYHPNKVLLGWRDNIPIGAGMYNVGNTCYLNSTLQALFHVPALVNWLLSDTHQCEQTGECLTCSMAKTLQYSHQKSGEAFKPFCIYNKLKQICRTMVLGQQEDAHEFLRYLLEGMERAYLTRHKATKLDNYSKETTPVNQIFGGYIRTEVKCLQCDHVSTTFQHFQDLLVDIRKASTLDEALSSYFSQEHLDNNDYKCEACKRRVPATKQFRLERPPKVLCVQLKRFSVMGGKISRHIVFKQTVDMGPYLWREKDEGMKKLNYKLTSMVTHMGPSVNCGHYTAIAQVSTGKYYCFDDSCVRQIPLNTVLNTNAYIMIFEMEPETQSQFKIHQSIKVNGAITSTKSFLPISLNSESKHSNSKPSTSANITQNGSDSQKHKEYSNQPATISQTSQKINGIHQSGQKSSSFIGPLLPQKLQEKSQPKLVLHTKNGKVSNGKSLVPYARSSDDEENNSGNAPKAQNIENSSNLKPNPFNSSNSNNVQKGLVSKKDSSPKPGSNSKDLLKTNGSCSASSNLKPLNGLLPLAKLQNGSSNGNGVIKQSSSPKHQNGKSESNGKSETNGKDKWSSPVKTKNSEDGKLAASSNGWQVSKDTPAPSSAAIPNGWSVTDNNKEEPSTKFNHNLTPYAAAVRDFNGTNRSETVSHLMKTSHRGYGSNSVTNWNGGRSRLDREVDDERRQERKRHMDPDDEEIDRGRTKKVKRHRDYENRPNTSYNAFQEYQNAKSWNHPIGGGGYRRNYYNTSNYGRARHVDNYGPSNNYRYDNSHNNRNHWQRR